MLNSKAVKLGPPNVRLVADVRAAVCPLVRGPPDQTKLGAPGSTPVNASDPIVVSLDGFPVCSGLSTAVPPVGGGGGGGGGGNSSPDGGGMIRFKLAPAELPPPVEPPVGPTGSIGTKMFIGVTNEGGPDGGASLDPLGPPTVGP